MGEPAALGERDRTDAKACATAIVDEVRNDGRVPSATLIAQAQRLGLQLDTLVLLLAQLALEAP
jgi:hypothetical protein